MPIRENFCAFGVGDCGSSSAITINSLVENINEKLMDVNTIAVNSTSCTSTTNQLLQFETGEKFVGINCDVILTNTISSRCDMDAVFNQSSSTNIINQVQQAIDSAATSGNSTTQGFLSGASPSSSDVSQTMSSYIKNLVSTKMTNEMQNSCIAVANADQTNIIKLNGTFDCSKKGSITAGNNAQIFAMTSCVSDQLMDILSKDDVLQQSISKSVATNTTVQTGFLQDLGTAVKDAGTAIAGIIKQFSTIFLIVAAVVVIIIIGAVIFLLSPAGQESTKQLASAAAKKI